MTAHTLTDASRQGLEPGMPRLLGGRLCLDFANSIEEPTGPLRQDFLASYPELVRWGRHAGAISDRQAAILHEAGLDQPSPAEATIRRALALRSAIDGIFRHVASGTPPSPADLSVVHDEYVIALRHASFAPSGARFGWHWPEDAIAPDRVLWPVASSAVELLMTGDLSRIKECPEGCTWLFYDLSKNGSRRWCSMEGCGSHAKMRRYRARQRSSVDASRRTDRDRSR